MAPAQRSLTAALASYWSAASYDDLPAEVVMAAKRLLLDTVAAGVAGAETDVARVVVGAMAAANGGGSYTGVSSLWGSDDTLSPPQAAMVNGTAAHALELDDFGGCGHSGAVVVPAICAAGDMAKVNGRDFLVAMVAGYDLAARVLDGAGGYQKHNEQGWHSCATCGSFGAAAGVARLLRLDQTRFTAALGIAGTFTGGIWAFLADGAMTKRFHPGKAAENGLSAALLAQAGMSGPQYVLEAEWGGFYSTYAGDRATPDLTLQDLGREFRIMRSGIKPYACCRSLHGCLDALFEVRRDHGFQPSDIEHIVVHGSEQTRRQFDRLEIGTLLDAQFSMQYSLAVAVESGRATLEQYLPLRHVDPKIHALMPRISIVADCLLKQGESPAVEILLADGRRLERKVAFASGGPERPLTGTEVTDKAAGLLCPVIGDVGFRALTTLIDDLEAVTDMRALSALLRPRESMRLVK